MANAVVHFEIVGRDHETLQQYYRDLFDWTVTQASPDFPYGLVSARDGDKGIDGGIGMVQPGGEPQLTFYVEVDDIQASLDRASALGGEVVMPVTTIPGMVTFAHFKDPEGNLVGLVASDAPPAG